MDEKKRLIERRGLNYSTMSESNREENHDVPVRVAVDHQQPSGQALSNHQAGAKPSNAARHYVSFLAVGLFLVIFIYIIPSAVLTKYTESQWSFLDAIYYCYISIATIGFGKHLAFDSRWLSLSFTSSSRTIVVISKVTSYLDTSKRAPRETTIDS